MMSLLWFILFVAVILFVAYRRFSLLNATIAFTVLLLAYSLWGAAGPLWKGLLWLALGVMWLLNVKSLRQTFITKPFLLVYRRLLPSMSSTEKEALEAGTVWWDGELFTGGPHWNKLMSAHPPRLTAEEQA
ncbi:MAG: acyl-CoA dehydrogenase, partial [Longimicrobiales bacterium]